jgi:dienelactone hydrolase
MAHSSKHARPETFDPACGDWKKDDPVNGMQVFVKGDPADPPVLLLHELPGLVPETVCFADRLVRRGYRVYMPLFFGAFGGRPGKLRQLAVCAGSDFNCLSTNESRIVGTLRTLRDRISKQHGGRNLAVIGMCLTGGIPLALADDKVAALVLSQPAIPFPVSAATRRSLGVSPGSLSRVNPDVYVLRIRFQKDCLVPPERFAAIAAAIAADHLETRVVPSNDPHEHSVLTGESHDPEAQKTIEYTYGFLDRRFGKVQAAR